jgi:predicted aldo/keto reductase-like oxidoreductase
MALNAADKHHYSFAQQLLPLAMEKQMGIIGMKVTGRSRILSSWTPPSLEAQKHMWEGVVQAKSPGTLNMREAMYYALTQPVSTVIVGIDNLDQLEENVKLAKAFTPLSEAQMTAIAQRTEPIAKQAMFYKFFNRA